MTTKPQAATIPPHFLEWLVASRRMLLDDMEQGRQVRDFPAHLPVIATWSAVGRHPVNLSIKGIGLVPRDDLMEDFTRECERVFDRAQETDWARSLPERIDTLRRLYADARHFEPSLLGGLEIFEGRTLQNLKSNSYASLLFMGMLPRPGRVGYISFQINAEVEILASSDPRYRFLLAARRLFEYDRFHLPQVEYPKAYAFRVIEVLDKSPFIKTVG
jgi:hypothetical protein